MVETTGMSSSANSRSMMAGFTDSTSPTKPSSGSRAEARINVRFNDLHTGAGVGNLLRRRLDDIGGDYDLDARVSGEPFLFPPGPLSNLVAGAVEKATGKRPEFSTAGGTSDARFIKDHCPVCEYGMTNQTAHKADENALVSDIQLLSDIYQSVLDGFFADPG